MNSSATCVPRLPEGAACTESGQCQKHLECDFWDECDDCIGDCPYNP